jgi:inositol transport system ATP-binding protein
MSKTDSWISELDGGMRQTEASAQNKDADASGAHRELRRRQPARGLIGRWLLTKPKILILDEPSRGIDVGAKAEVHRLISKLAGEGLAGHHDFFGIARGSWL